MANMGRLSWQSLFSFDEHLFCCILIHHPIFLLLLFPLFPESPLSDFIWLGWGQVDERDRYINKHAATQATAHARLNQSVIITTDPAKGTYICLGFYTTHGERDVCFMLKMQKYICRVPGVYIPCLNTLWRIWT